MPQNARPTNTIAQLLFAEVPALNFARLVTDLDAAFRNCPAEGRQLRWDHDDLAILDVQGSRIILSWATDLTGPHRACLTVGVGYGPGVGSPGLAQRQATVARMIAERIAGRHQPDTVLWQETREVLDDLLLDALTAAQEERAAVAPQTEAAPVAMSRLEMRSGTARLTFARMSAQVYEIARGRLERAGDPQEMLRRLLGLGDADSRARPRRIGATA